MVAIIDYGAGNIKSVENAVKYLGHEAVLTRDPEVILSADHGTLFLTMQGKSCIMKMEKDIFVQIFI